MTRVRIDTFHTIQNLYDTIRNSHVSHCTNIAVTVPTWNKLSCETCPNGDVGYCAKLGMTHVYIIPCDIVTNFLMAHLHIHTFHTVESISDTCPYRHVLEMAIVPVRLVQ